MIDPKQDDEQQAEKEKIDNQTDIKIDKKERKYYHNVGKYHEKLVNARKDMNVVHKELVEEQIEELNQERIKKIIEKINKELDQEVHQQLEEIDELEEEEERE